MHFGSVQTPRYLAAGFLLCASLAACGGGGGGGTTPTTTSTPTSIPTATSPPLTTNATGTVVNDANGSPLAGVRVVLMPWAPCGATPAPTSITPENDGCPTPLPSPQARTNSSGQFTLNGVPNGHYMLVVGAETVTTPPPGYAPPTCTTGCATPTPAPFTVAATVHDNVTLTGGNQTLKAPTLPSQQSGYPAPTWETNGDYRVASLDASTEMPCYVAWNYDRAQHSLAGSTADEWTLENIRAVNGWEQSPTRSGQGAGISTYGSGIGGGTSCDLWMQNLVFAGQAPYALNPMTMYFGARYAFYTPSGLSLQAVGNAEWLVDPRAYTDPNYSGWP